MRQISVNEGLSNIRVNDTMVDDDGSMWIATQRGLDRVIEGVVVPRDYGDLNNNVIRYIFKDKVGNIWCISRSQLYAYNRENDTFERVVLGEDTFYANITTQVESGVIFANMQKIYLYSYETDRIEEVVIDGEIPFEYKSVISAKDGDDLLIVGGDDTNNSLFRYSAKTHRLDRYEGVDLSDTHIIQNIFLDSRNQVWVPTYNEGLRCFSIEGEGDLVRRLDQHNSELTGAVALSLNEADGMLWVAIEGSKINLIDVESFEFADINSVYGYRLGLLAHSVVSCDLKNPDDYYLSTMRQGLVNLKRSPIRSIKHSIGNANLQSNVDFITFISLYEDSQGKIWMGAGNSGLAIYNRHSLSIDPIETGRDLRIADIIELDSDNLLISANHKGLFKFNKKSHKFTKIRHDVSLFKQPLNSFDAPINFLRISDDEILITAANLTIYNQKRDEIRVVEESINSFFFKAVCMNGNNAIIYNGESILSVDVATGEIRNLYSISSSDIEAVTLVGDRLWFAQNSDIVTITLDGEDIYRYRCNSEDKYWTLQPGKNGDIWLTSYNYLVVFSTETREFKTLYKDSDGYVRDHYINKASKPLSSGNILMAGNNGFLFLDTDITINPKSELDIKIFQASVDETRLITTFDDRIVLPWDYNTLDLRFALKGGDPLSSCRYRYQISGDQSSYTIYQGNDLSLPMLSSGDYTIEVSYFKPEGVWSQRPHILNISVDLPWWQSWWFYTSVLLFATLLTLFFVGTHLRTKRLELSQMKKDQEQRLFSDKVRFLINISHELRTSLTLIYAPLKRIIGGFDTTSPLNEELSRIASQSRQMINLLNMTLNLRKMESGYGEINIQKVELSTWLTDIAEEFRAELAVRGVDLQYQFGKDCTTLNFDPSMCRIILSNLLMNGCKYSLSDSVLLVKTERVKDKIRISVVDQGVGLEGIDPATLFDRFVQYHDKTSGSGVGLSYSKMLVELHPGGVIGASDNEGAGATFYFEIPVGLECKVESCKSMPYINQIIETIVDSEEQADSLDIDYPLNNYTVLVVEDNIELLEFLKETLQATFKSVYIAKNGEKALEMALKYTPDIILSDIMMPKMNGYELCVNIKRDINVSHIPVILMTAKDESDTRKFGYKLGADGYLPKPFDIDELVSILRNQLHSREIVRQRYSDTAIGGLESSTTFSNIDEQFLLKLNSFIRDNISDTDLSSTMLVDHMCMGRTSFYDKVRALTSMGVMEYVNKHRMMIAAERLCNTNKTISQVAESVGCFDGKYFGKIFKKEFGLAPREYRNASRTSANNDE